MYKIVSDDIIKRGVSRDLIAACVFYLKDRKISEKKEIANILFKY